MPRKGEKCTEEHRRKISLAKMGEKNPMYGRRFSRLPVTREKIRQAKLSDRNPMWKADGQIGIATLHQWVRYHLHKPNLCPTCVERPPYDVSNISPKYNRETYNRDLKNWTWQCRTCHMLTDGRMKNLKQFQSGTRLKLETKI